MKRKILALVLVAVMAGTMGLLTGAEQGKAKQTGSILRTRELW